MDRRKLGQAALWLYASATQGLHLVAIYLCTLMIAALHCTATVMGLAHDKLTGKRRDANERRITVQFMQPGEFGSIQLRGFYDPDGMTRLKLADCLKSSLAYAREVDDEARQRRTATLESIERIFQPLVHEDEEIVATPAEQATVVCSRSAGDIELAEWEELVC